MTTTKWWEEVKNDEGKLIHWLKAQYHGEVTAAIRILQMAKDYSLEGTNLETIEIIARDEAVHAEWVKELLSSRGITAEVLVKEERYWNETLPEVDKRQTFSYMCAVAHHAEIMRLDRINLLSRDSRFTDIAEVFKKIQSDEVFHAKAFKEMSTEKDIKDALEFHEDGLNALGLVA